MKRLLLRRYCFWVVVCRDVWLRLQTTYGSCFLLNLSMQFLDQFVNFILQQNSSHYYIYWKKSNKFYYRIDDWIGVFTFHISSSVGAAPPQISAVWFPPHQVIVLFTFHSKPLYLWASITIQTNSVIYLLSSLSPPLPLSLYLFRIFSVHSPQQLWRYLQVLDLVTISLHGTYHKQLPIINCIFCHKKDKNFIHSFIHSFILCFSVFIFVGFYGRKGHSIDELYLCSSNHISAYQ
jgi:hypothetical protein